MYAIPGKIRNFYLRVPVSDMMIEPIQWSDAKGKPLNPRMQDPGATRLILNVNNIDVLTDRLRQGGAKVISAGGKPLTLTDETGRKRVIVFEDFNGFFVELVQREPLPPRTGDAPPTFYIDRSDFALTVSDLDKSAKFYGEILGLQVKTDASFRTDAKRLDALGMKEAQYREATVVWPDKTPQVRLVEFKGIDRKPLTPLVPDPCSTILRINVRDVDSILAKVKTFPDAKIMNVSGRPTLQGRTVFVIVRAPGGTYLQFVGPAPNQSQ
jgi:predicted enzyme related to lactoylglutathione lyase